MQPAMNERNFCGIPDDTSGCLFYVPSTKCSYMSLDVVFDESFTSSLVLPDLPYQGVIKLRGTGGHFSNQDTHFEHTVAPIGQEETFLHKKLGIPRTSR